MFGTDFHVRCADSRNHDSLYDVIVWFFLPATPSCVHAKRRYRLSVILAIFFFFKLRLLLAVTPSPHHTHARVQSYCRRHLAFYLFVFVRPALAVWLPNVSSLFPFSFSLAIFLFTCHHLIVDFQHSRSSRHTFVFIHAYYLCRVV